MRGSIAAVILRTLILADLSDMLITNIVCVRNSQYGVSGKQSVLNIWEAVIDIKYNGLASQLSTCHPGHTLPTSHVAQPQVIEGKWRLKILKRRACEHHQ